MGVVKLPHESKQQHSNGYFIASSRWNCSGIKTKTIQGNRSSSRHLLPQRNIRNSHKINTERINSPTQQPPTNSHQLHKNSSRNSHKNDPTIARKSILTRGVNRVGFHPNLARSNPKIPGMGLHLWKPKWEFKIFKVFIYGWGLGITL